jgi:hypothetical protein
MERDVHKEPAPERFEDGAPVEAHIPQLIPQPPREEG